METTEIIQMKVIASGRKTSRTTQLIELCAELEAKGEISYIVVGTQREAHMVAQKAKELDLTIGFPITFDEFLNQQYFGPHIKHFLIDNVDHLLYRLTTIHIAAVTILKENDG